jgi:hypothetical protein
MAVSRNRRSFLGLVVGLVLVIAGLYAYCGSSDYAGEK